MHKNMVYAKREKKTTLDDRCIMLSLASEVGIYRTKFPAYIKMNACTRV
ncbi:hypothetical protein HMPREF1991_00675 [Hoylesella loescheii DSM 19665 = JCM 12249 = ATCC 15930]|uniref:Uncharacterized protein n=1 Tax=Hoylesella loescheii DSM 19665 = JCM 12249 = ATCC 15930 TaxID=1122985 RepID=A0A069QTX2_HOYLO|nr:hypothetical protein HMPREF1991_00675 [Hoylesella loescheii DSM 19665 = JCM 12249 = ATCC 15930]